ncbi:MAG: hypothetical protein B7733_22880 [Myxococcales bacterium FL481]|nr:MAG: hypothetical protein B7733_22880 [Myxococcales bacterium FL481]
MRSGLVVTALCTPIGCSQGAPDPTPSSSVADPTGAGGEDTSAGDSTPSETTVPGGAVDPAPVVGCEGARRPARRSPSASEVCEAAEAGRCWYVSPEGSDTDPGTFSQPFATPQAAVRLAGPGDVIYLRGGVYDDTHAHPYRATSWNEPDEGVERGFITIGTLSFPAWAELEGYSVASGTAAAPIRVRSLPGERACASGAGSIHVGSLTQETAHWRFEDLTLHRGAVLLSGGSAQGTKAVNQTHDIEIRHIEVYEYAAEGATNVGLIRINRGDWGGPYNVSIRSNILHDLIPIDGGETKTWDTTTDAQHYGAVTTLSCEVYVDPGCIGTGSILIENNLVYHVPQAFFFKNPAAGPIEIRGNLFREIGGMGTWVSSNITFAHNLVMAEAPSLGGEGGEEEQETFARNGHDLRMLNNTFVGVDRIAFLRVFAKGHTVRGNVIQGLRAAATENTWDNVGYIGQGDSWIDPDAATDFAQSHLVDNEFDDNCFVPETPDFTAYGRRYDPGSGTVVQQIDLEGARAELGHELSSDVATVAEVFTDFAHGDYRVREGVCGGRGATLAPWAVSEPE